jgi:hypothetical protein
VIAVSATRSVCGCLRNLLYSLLVDTGFTEVVHPLRDVRGWMLVKANHTGASARQLSRTAISEDTKPYMLMDVLFAYCCSLRVCCPMLCEFDIAGVHASSRRRLSGYCRAFGGQDDVHREAHQNHLYRIG